MAEEPSVVSDFSGYVNRVTKLLRLDAALLSIETKQNLLSMAIMLALMAGAGAVAFIGVVILVFAIILLLIQLGMSPALAAFFVALALFAGAGAMAFLALQRLKVWTLMPRRTLSQFRANIEALRASLQNEPKPNR